MALLAALLFVLRSHNVDIKACRARWPNHLRVAATAAAGWSMEREAGIVPAPCLARPEIGARRL